MAAAPAEPIEAVFRPSTRYRDSHRDDPLPAGWTEVELLPGLSLENVRATRTTWDAFDSFARQKLVWMTPAVCVCSEDMEDSDYQVVLTLGCDAGSFLSSRVAVVVVVVVVVSSGGDACCCCCRRIKYPCRLVVVDPVVEESSSSSSTDSYTTRRNSVLHGASAAASCSFHASKTATA
jgi:hypothetical protein